MTQNPRVRGAQASAVLEDGAQMILLTANDGIMEDAVMVSMPAYYLITLMDGSNSYSQICEKFQDQFNVKVPEKDVISLAAKLDEAYLLDNKRYRLRRQKALGEFYSAPARAAVHAGKSYPEDPKILAGLIGECFHQGPNAGDPAESVIVPHIDFRVGSAMMAAGWNALPHQPGELIVMLGTGHYLAEDFFACIDKDFDTPLGKMEVDREFLSALAKNFGEDIYANSFAHKNEHSIEFQALFMAGRAQLRPGQKCVPILLSFPENIWDVDHPVFNGKRLERFLSAVAKTADGAGKKVRYVASVDFAHIGQRFGDQEPLTPARLQQAEREDMELVETFQKIEPAQFLEKIIRVNHKNRICGFPALYALFKLSKAKRGKLLGYRQNVEGSMENMVSFAAMALYE